VTGYLRRLLLVGIFMAEGVLAVLGLERIDVNGSIGRLGRDILVQGIPSDALDVMAMFCYLSDQVACEGRQIRQGTHP
jgi:hypothetical protein